MKVQAGNISGLALLAALSVAAQASAATVISSNFSMGFGKTGNNGYTTDETSGVNTNVAGDFALDVTVAGGAQDGNGPVFTNRVLADGGAGNYSGEPSDFLATLSATYSGTPIDADAFPNYQIQIVITSISIYAQGVAGAPSIGFIETTAGHEQAQIQQPLNAYSDMRLASFYTPVAWDPADHVTDGISQTRTFALTLPGGTAFLDGFEVEGYITLDYVAVPEPVLCSLIVPGAMILMRRRAR